MFVLQKINNDLTNLDEGANEFLDSAFILWSQTKWSQMTLIKLQLSYKVVCAPQPQFLLLTVAPVTVW